MKLKFLICDVRCWNPINYMKENREIQNLRTTTLFNSNVDMLIEGGPWCSGEVLPTGPRGPGFERPLRTFVWG